MPLVLVSPRGPLLLALAALLGCSADVAPPARPSVQRYRDALVVPLPDHSVVFVGGRAVDGVRTDGIVRIDPVTRNEVVVAHLSAPQSGGAWVRVGDGVYLVGGERDDGWSDQIHRWSARDDTVLRWDRLPIPLVHPVAAVVGEDLVVCGHTETDAGCWRRHGVSWRQIAPELFGWPREIVVEAGAQTMLVLCTGSPGEALSRVDLTTGRTQSLHVELGVGAHLIADGGRTVIVPGPPDWILPDTPVAGDVLALRPEDTAPTATRFVLDRQLAGATSALVDGALWVVGGGRATASIHWEDGSTSILALPKDLRGGVFVPEERRGAKPQIFGAYPSTPLGDPCPYGRVFRLPRGEHWAAHRRPPP